MRKRDLFMAGALVAATGRDLEPQRDLRRVACDLDALTPIGFRRRYGMSKFEAKLRGLHNLGNVALTGDVESL